MEETQQNRAPEPTTLQRWGAYFITLLSYSSFGGLIGAYAIVKKPLAAEIHAEEGFLGYFMKT